MNIHAESFFNKQKLIKIFRTKIIFQYFFVVITAFILGWNLHKILSEAYLSSALYSLTEYFQGYSNCNIKISECFKYALEYSIFDFIGLFLILLFAFSSLTCWTSNFILLFKGLKIGYIFSIFYLLFKSEFGPDLPLMKFFVFLIIKLSSVGILFRHSCVASEFSVLIRNNLKQKNTLSLLTLIISAFVSAIAIIILNFAHFLYIYIL